MNEQSKHTTRIPSQRPNGEPDAVIQRPGHLPFFMGDVALVRNAGLSVNARMAYCILATYADTDTRGTGRAKTYRKRLAADLGKSVATWDRAALELEEAGMVTRQRQRSATGQANDFTIYVLHDKESWFATKAAPEEGDAPVSQGGSAPVRHPRRTHASLNQEPCPEPLVQTKDWSSPRTAGHDAGAPRPRRKISTRKRVEDYDQFSEIHDDPWTLDRAYEVMRQRGFLLPGAVAAKMVEDDHWDGYVASWGLEDVDPRADEEDAS